MAFCWSGTKYRVISAHKSCGDRVVVSIKISARARTDCIKPRSSSIPESAAPSGERWCRRRVSENLRIKTSTEQSRYRTSSLIAAFTASVSIVSIIWLEAKSLLRVSSPSANGRCKAGPSSKRGARVSGRLSMASKPTSSRALIAVVLPAPEGPVTSTTCVICEVSLIVSKSILNQKHERCSVWDGWATRKH